MVPGESVCRLIDRLLLGYLLFTTGIPGSTMRMEMEMAANGG